MHVQEEIPVKEEAPPKLPEIKVEEPIPKIKDNQKLVKMLLVSIREYEDMIYLKQYSDTQEKDDIQAIVDNLKV